MGFFKRAGTSTGRKRGRPPKNNSSTAEAKKLKFEKKQKSNRKKDALDEEIPSSSEEEYIGDVEEVKQKRQRPEENNVEGEQQYEDDRTLADREALKLLEATKEISTGLNEPEDEEEDEKQKEEAAINARAHRPIADQIQTTAQISCQPHRLSPVCICFSRNSDFLVSCAKDRSLIKYDLKKRCRVGILRAEPKGAKNKKGGGAKKSTKKFCPNFHNGQILCCAISPDDKYLITGGSDSLIKIWSFDTLEFLHDFDGHRGPITSIRFRQQCEALEMFTSSRDRSIMVWNLDEMGFVNTLYGHQDAVEQLDILQWPRLVSCGGMDKSCRLFKILEDSHLVFNGFAECVSSDCIALINEEHFISGNIDGSLYIWSTTRKKPICVRRHAHGFQQDDQPTESMETEQNKQKAVKEPRWICAVAALPYTDLVASGSSDGFLRLWRVSQDWKKLDQVQQIQMPGFINDIRFSSDGHFIGCAVGQEHKRGRWWILKGGSEGTELKVRNRLVVIPFTTTRTNESNNGNGGNDDEGGSGEIMEITSQSG